MSIAMQMFRRCRWPLLLTLATTLPHACSTAIVRTNAAKLHHKSLRARPQTAVPAPALGESGHQHLRAGGMDPEKQPEAALTSDDVDIPLEAVASFSAVRHNASASSTLGVAPPYSTPGVAPLSSMPGAAQAPQLPVLDSLSEAERKKQQQNLLCMLKKSLHIKGVLQRTVTEPEGKTLPQVKGTCAVVSSGGGLLLHKNGKSIDSASAVMRFNLAPTAGYGEHVGYRTDIRFVNEKVLDMWNHYAGADVLQDGGKVSASCTLCEIGYRQGCDPQTYAERVLNVNRLFPDVELYASDLKVEYVLHRLLSKWYGLGASPAGTTTGAVGMAIALSLCDEVKAYGMADSVQTVSAPYHYWEASGHYMMNATRSHHKTFDAERDFWRRLASNSLYDVDSTSVAVIPGFAKVECPEL
eukprot:CAMPEP_0117482488 /NCGR_PEP_ID=MMETSP0784-20121206/13445_1 /TAXON_ID=39447 /ORGANISM="" /LENGTH=411 /DNA_ID=CAMNT_0005276985 /DNA_START=30 /DNA_END=1265 /DNA_ORIENTATION=+